MKLTPLYMREEILCRGDVVRTTYRLRTWLVFGVVVFRREHVVAISDDGVPVYP